LSSMLQQHAYIRIDIDMTAQGLTHWQSRVPSLRATLSSPSKGLSNSESSHCLRSGLGAKRASNKCVNRRSNAQGIWNEGRGVTTPYSVFKSRIILSCFLLCKGGGLQVSNTPPHEKEAKLLFVSGASSGSVPTREIETQTKDLVTFMGLELGWRRQRRKIDW